MTHPFGFQLAKKYVCVSTVGPSPAHIRALEPLPARLAWSVHAADDKLRKLLVPTTRHTMAELRDAWGERRPAVTPRSAGCNPLAHGLQPHAPRLQPHVAGEVLEARRDRGLMAEVTLIDGVNDGAEHAEELHALLAPLPGTSRTSLTPHCNPMLQPHASRLQAQPRVSGKTRINLIPYNANAGLGAAGRLFLPSPPEAVQAFHARLIDLGVICTVRVPRGNEEDSACGMLRVTKGGPAVDY
jgi:23S rRNA (adenine2503-C2)-methyltransferase